MSSSSDEEIIDIKPPVISEEALLLPRNGLPPNSREKYQKAYEDFIQWKTEKKAKSFSENVLLVYFNYLSKSKRPSTLWCEYSKLKSTLRLKENVNIGDYTKLITFLKRKSVGFMPKKSKVLSGNNIGKFIKEAPDEQYLLEKDLVTGRLVPCKFHESLMNSWEMESKTPQQIILIFGINGACRSNELTALTINDVETCNDKMIVRVRCPAKDRTFIIQDEILEVVQKYQQLRPVGTKSDRFFLNFKNGKCTQLPVGRHKIAAIPQLIAKYLNLPDPESYTGHCFRRSSATLLADTGADVTTLKRHGGWLSDKVAEGYIKESIGNQSLFTTQLHEGTLKTLIEPELSTSADPLEAFDTKTPEASSTSSSTVNSSKNVEVNLSGNTIQLSLSNLTNCHISINFN